MPGNESLHPKDLVVKGDSDLNAVEILLKAKNLDVAALHIQQAIEKYLKGFLLRRGWSLVKTHDLVDLLNEAINYEPAFEKFSATMYPDHRILYRRTVSVFGLFRIK